MRLPSFCLCDSKSAYITLLSSPDSVPGGVNLKLVLLLSSVMVPPHCSRHLTVPVSPSSTCHCAVQLSPCCVSPAHYCSPHVTTVPGTLLFPARCYCPRTLLVLSPARYFPGVTVLNVSPCHYPRCPQCITVYSHDPSFCYCPLYYCL